MQALKPLILATQAGLPLTPQPYHAIAAQLNSDAETVITGLQALLDAGAIRRIGVVPNHYRIGYAANGMTVWNVADEKVDELGERVGALEFVTHCYRRPRHLPDWPYNLFAMAHGASRAEVSAKADRIASILGDACRDRPEDGQQDHGSEHRDHEHDAEPVGTAPFTVPRHPESPFEGAAEDRRLGAGRP